MGLWRAVELSWGKLDETDPTVYLCIKQLKMNIDDYSGGRVDFKTKKGIQILNLKYVD